MPDYQKMYLTAFNAITDALEELDRLNIGRAKARLREAQCRAEDIFVSQDGEDGSGEFDESEESGKPGESEESGKPGESEESGASGDPAGSEIPGE